MPFLPNSPYAFAYVARRDSTQMPLPALTKKSLPVASLACSGASNSPTATSPPLAPGPSIFYALSFFD